MTITIKLFLLLAFINFVHPGHVQVKFTEVISKDKLPVYPLKTHADDNSLENYNDPYWPSPPVLVNSESISEWFEETSNCNISQKTIFTSGSNFACSSTRNKRQVVPSGGSVKSGMETANVLVNSETSNISVSHLIDITSGRSMVDIHQDPVRVKILSERANVRIDPGESYVNVTVQVPFVLVNVTDRISLQLVSLYSEAYINTNPSNAQLPNVLISSGPSNLTVHSSSGASIEAMTEGNSQIEIRIGQQSNVSQDEILIESGLLENGGNFERELKLTSITPSARFDLQLIQFWLWIRYDSIQMQISSRDHEILVFTGVYTIRVKTLLSPFRIRITSMISIEIDNSSINIYPDTSNVTGSIPNSLLMIRPDNASRIQILTNDQQNALENSAIDLESKELALRVVPSDRRISIESILSNAVITSKFGTVGVRSNKSNIEIVSGSPYLLALTGNTSVQIRTGGGVLTLPSGSELPIGALAGPAPNYATVNPPFLFTVNQPGMRHIPAITPARPMPPVTNAPTEMPSTTSPPLPTPSPFQLITANSSGANENVTINTSNTSSLEVEGAPFTDQFENSTSTISSTESSPNLASTGSNINLPMQPTPQGQFFNNTTEIGRAVDLSGALANTANSSASETSLAMTSTTPTATVNVSNGDSTNSNSPPGANVNESLVILGIINDTDTAAPIDITLVTSVYNETQLSLENTTGLGNGQNEISEIDTVADVNENQTIDGVATEPMIGVESGNVTIQTFSPPSASTISDFIIAQFSLQSTPPSTLESLTEANSSALGSTVGKEYMLSVGVRVRRSTDTHSSEFYNAIREGLVQAYMEGKDRQLGIREVRRRQKRNGEDTTATVMDETQLQTLVPFVPGMYRPDRTYRPDVKLTSVDRVNRDQVKVRFYMVNNQTPIEASKATATFDQLSLPELSSFLTYPVVQPVQSYEYEESQEVEPAIDGGSVIVAILVAVAIVLILALILALFLYRYKKKRKLIVKEIRPQTNQYTGNAEIVNEEKYDVHEATTEKRDNQTLTSRTTSHLGQMPKLKSKMIREMSAEDVDDYEITSYSELFGYVKSPAAHPPAVHRQLNPIQPITPSMGFNTSRAVDMWPPSPPVQHPTRQQIFPVSPSSRRRLARHLLDSAFPLANIRVEDILRDNVTAPNRNAC